MDIQKPDKHGCTCVSAHRSPARRLSLSFIHPEGFLCVTHIDVFHAYCHHDRFSVLCHNSPQSWTSLFPSVHLSFQPSFFLSHTHTNWSNMCRRTERLRQSINASYRWITKSSKYDYSHSAWIIKGGYSYGHMLYFCFSYTLITLELASGHSMIFIHHNQQTKCTAGSRTNILFDVNP